MLAVAMPALANDLFPAVTDNVPSLTQTLLGVRLFFPCLVPPRIDLQGMGWWYPGECYKAASWQSCTNNYIWPCLCSFPVG